MVDFSITYPFAKSDAESIKEPLLAVVLDSIKSVQEVDEGYVLNCGRNPECVDPLAKLIMVQRVLNPFLRLSLTVESNDGPIKLELSGPEGTKDFLRSEFVLKRWTLK